MQRAVATVTPTPIDLIVYSLFELISPVSTDSPAVYYLSAIAIDQQLYNGNWNEVTTKTRR